MNGLLSSLLWVLAASFLGFGISFVFADRIQLSRRVFLIPYVGLTTAFLLAFGRAGAVDPTDLLVENWLWGAVAGIVVGAILTSNVRSQPASRESVGGELLLDIAWLGVVYGIIDALFLNVMPVLATWNGLSRIASTDSWGTSIGVGALAMAASLLVTLAYHLGYAEFRNRSVGLVLFGNALITLAFLVSTNPLGSILSHTLMHLAAVIRGPETTIQLPPHQKARHS